MFALDVSLPYKHMCHLADILFPPMYLVLRDQNLSTEMRRQGAFCFQKKDNEYCVFTQLSQGKLQRNKKAFPLNCAIQLLT